MKVYQLIEHLKQFDQELDVAYYCCSEQVLMKKEQIAVTEACKPRPDGWIQDKRPDMESQKYLMFPGH